MSTATVWKPHDALESSPIGLDRAVVREFAPQLHELDHYLGGNSLERGLER